MPGPGRRCQVCDRVWRQRAARFCGTCGGPLGADQGAGARPRPTALVASWWQGHPRRVVGIASVVLLSVALATSLVLGVGSLPVFTTTVEEVEVAGPADADLETTPGLGDRDPEQADQLRALVDPNRLRCRPAPCELWRTRVDGGQPWQLRARAGRVGVLDGTDVVLLDLATGREHLRASLVSDGSVTGDGDPIAGPQQSSTATPLDDGVAVVIGDRVLVVDDDGTWRWDRRIAGAGMGYLDVVGGNLRLEAPAGRGGGSTLWLLDADTGETRFERTGMSGPWTTPQDDLMLVWDASTGARDAIVAVDPRDGEVLWERPLPPDGGVYPLGLGELLLLRHEPAFWYGGPVDDEGGTDDTEVVDEGGTDDTEVVDDGADDASDDDLGRGDEQLLASIRQMGPSELLDLRTGRTVHTFDDPVIGAASRAGQVVVATASPEDATRIWGAQSARGQLPVLSVQSFDAAGTLRNAVPLETAVVDGCCVDLWSDGGEVVLRTRSETLVVRPDGQLEPRLGQRSDEWTDPLTGLQHIWREDGMLLRAADGSSVELSSGDVWILGHEDGVVAVATDREVLAVRLVPPSAGPEG